MTDLVTVEVVRTADASREKLEVSLSQTLNELKRAISKSSLGPIETKHQRLFHLGRELKNGGRSLSTLGLGRYHNFILHLHSTKPKSYDLSSDDDDEEDDDDDDEDDNNQAKKKKKKKKKSPGATTGVVKKESRERAASVVDLLDSDDETDPTGRTDKRRRIS